MMGLRPDDGEIIILQPQQLERRVTQLKRENERQQRELTNYNAGFKD